jgi:hypothetical protein
VSNAHDFTALFSACASQPEDPAVLDADEDAFGRHLYEMTTSYWESEAPTCGSTTFSGIIRRTVQVERGGDLQAAIDAATPGTEIVLEANGTYWGNFVLRNKGTASTSYITIRAGSPLSSGIRVTPADRASLARVYAKNALPVFRTEAGAHHYRLVNLEIAAPSHATNTLIELGTGLETSTSQSPHHVILDRLYVKGDPTLGGKRGVALNGRYLTVQNSWISNFKSLTQDSQAVAGWNGAGNWVIANNYLEAAGENLLIGGADPRISQLVPTHIRIKFNHVKKQLSWRPGDPSYAGKLWVVKNLVELKNARDVIIEGNLIENVWPQSQKGFAILFTPRNQDGKAPWSQVADVILRRNHVRNVAAAVNILGHDDIATSAGTEEITIEHNRFENVGGEWGDGASTAGRVFQLISGTGEPGPTDVIINHNTATNSGGHYLLGVGGDTPKPGFVFKNQVVNNELGVYGDGMGNAEALRTNFPDAVFTANALVGGRSSDYAAYSGNYFPSVDTMTSLTASTSILGKSTDGKDLGVNQEFLDLASPCW